MIESTDGFKLAETDLEIRGPGDMLGTRQAGEIIFNQADLIKDKDILLKAQEIVTDIIKNDTTLSKPENQYIKKVLELKYSLIFNKLN